MASTLRFSSFARRRCMHGPVASSSSLRHQRRSFAAAEKSPIAMQAASASLPDQPSAMTMHKKKAPIRVAQAPMQQFFFSASSASTPDSNGLDFESHMKMLVKERATPLNLSTMYRYACPHSFSRLANAQFLHRELQIRIAHRLTELQNLRYGLSEMPMIKQIVATYQDYLRLYCEKPAPTTDKEEEEFTIMLRNLVMDRSSIPSAVYHALANLNWSPDRTMEEIDDLERQLVGFMMARIGLRFLTEHHVLSSPDQEMVREFRRLQGYLNDDTHMDDSGSIGAISRTCDPVLEAQMVAKQVRTECLESFGVAPEISVVDASSAKRKNRPFTYVPHHLHYMIAELLKNSCRAIVRRHGMEDSLPPIRIVVVKGKEDVSIKIADQGGGIPRSVMDRVWTYAHSTILSNLEAKNGAASSSDPTKAVEPLPNSADGATAFDTNAFTNVVDTPTTRGYGLPMARRYAQYFGGELTLKSMEGFGVDAYLYLPVLGVECENLPERVSNSPGNMDSSDGSDSDWDASEAEYELADRDLRRTA